MAEVVGDIGEHALIGRISERMTTTPSVVVGTGDDAAVIHVSGDTAVCTDAMVEGVHFRRDWSTAQQVGGKLVARNFADIAAIGATPVGFTLSMTLPADLSVGWVEDLIAGVNAECARAGAAFLGGDTSSGPVLVLVGSAVGDTGAWAPVLRSGARPGDAVAVHGALGCAAAGLALLTRGREAAEAPSTSSCIGAHLLPQPDYAQATAIAGLATSMIDTSDGLIADAQHIARASSVDITIETENLPVSGCLRDAAESCEIDVLEWVLTGGEDHAFLATFPPHHVPDGWHVIGTVVAGGGDVRLDGQLWSGRGGYEHFTGRSSASRLNP